MKQNQNRPQSLVFLKLFAVLFALVAGTAQAANLYWSTNGVLGGGGTWDTSSAVWSTAPSGPFNTAWVNANNDVAFFAGTAGIVTNSTSITNGGLQFNTTAYTITNTSGALLAFGAANNAITFNNVVAASISGPVGGTGNVSLTQNNPSLNGYGSAGTFTLNGTSSGGWSGNTTINGSMTLALSASNQGLFNTTGITLNGGTLTLGNTTSTEGSLDRVADGAGITVNGGGGTINYNNNTGNTYAETIGTVTLTAGQLIILEGTSMGSGTQTLTLSGLTRTGAANSSVISAGSGGGFGVAGNIIRVNGVATATTAGQIIGPWATYGTAPATPTDYLIYQSSDGTYGRFGLASISSSAENSGLWVSGANVTLGGATSLTATRTINTLRYTGGTGSLDLNGANNLETYGLLNSQSAGTLTLTNSTLAGTGFLTTPNTGAGTTNGLYLTAGSAITSFVPIKDNTSVVTLVKSGAGTLTLTNASTFTGGLVVNGGTVNLNTPQSFTGGVTLNSATLLGNAGGGLAAAALGNNNITVNGASLIRTLAGETFNGGIAINAGGYLDFGHNNTSGGSVTVSGPLTGSGTLDVRANNLNKDITFNFNSTANTFTGNVAFNNVNNSILTFNFASLGDGGKIFIEGLNGNAKTYTFTGANAGLTWNSRQIVFTGANNLTYKIANNTAFPFAINSDLDASAATGLKTLTLGGNGTGLSTFGGRISNGGTTMSIAKVDSGTWALTNANTYTGGTTVSAGILQADNNAALGTGLLTVSGASTLSNNVAGITLTNPVSLGNTLTVGVPAGTNFTLGGIITNTGALTKSGTGTLTLTNSSTYTGATTVSAGTLKLTGGSLGNTAVTLQNTTTFAVQPGSATIIALGNTSGAATAGGALTLIATSTFDMTDGGLSTFNVVGGSTYATAALTSASGTTWKFDLGNTDSDHVVLYKGATAGSGVASLAAGNVIISTAGATALTPGSYTLISAASGIATSGWTINGGANQTVTVGATTHTLTVSASATALTLNVSGAASKLAFTTQPVSALVSVTLGQQPVVQIQDANGTAVAASGVTITLSGVPGLTGTLTAVTDSTGKATFSGLSVNTAGANLQMTASASGLTSATSTPFNILSGAVPTNNGIYTNTTSGGLWFAGASWTNGIIANGSGSTADFSTLDITADNTVRLDFPVTLTSLIFGDTVTSTPAGWTVDNGGISANNLTLAGTTPSITVNTLGGAKTTTINANIAGSTAWTKQGAGTLVLSGTTNASTGSITVSSGTLLISGQQLLSIGRTNTIAAGATLNLSNSVNNFTASPMPTSLIIGGGTFRLSGNSQIQQSGGGSSGTQRLTFGMSAGGLIDLQDTALLLNGGWQEVFWTTNKASLNIATGAKLDIWDGNQVYVDALTGSGTVDKNQTAGSGNTLNIGVAGGSGTFSGTIKNTITPAISLVKIGSGTQTLSGNNTYGGTTDVAGGMLKIAGANSLPSTGNLNLRTNGMLGLAAGDFTRALGTGGGQVQWNGGGAGNSGLSGGFAAYGADRTVNLGGSGATVSWASGSFVPNGGALLLSTPDADATIIWQNPINLNSASSITRTIYVQRGLAAVDARLNGAISSAGAGLNLNGGGKLQTTADNTYTGGTLISGGTLELGNNGGTGKLSATSAISVNSSTSTLSINRNNAFSQTADLNNKAIIDLGNFAQVGSGTTTLTVSNSYQGTTTISGGTLALGAAYALSQYTTAVTNGTATLDAQTFANSANGPLVVTGTATNNFGVGGTLAFANSSAVAWPGTLRVTGNFVSGSSLRFGTTSSGLTAAQLAKITIPSGAPVGLNSSGYLVALPVVAPNLTYTVGAGAGQRILVSDLITSNGIYSSQGSPAWTIASAGPTSTQGGSVSNGTSQMQYTAPNSTITSDTFTYTLSDGVNTSAAATVTINFVQQSGGNANITVSGNTANATLFGIPGQNYGIQRSTNGVNGPYYLLSSPPLTNTVLPITAAGDGSVKFSDTNIIYPSAFYRLIQQ